MQGLLKMEKHQLGGYLLQKVHLEYAAQLDNDSGGWTKVDADLEHVLED